MSCGDAKEGEENAYDVGLEVFGVGNDDAAVLVACGEGGSRRVVVDDTVGPGVDLFLGNELYEGWNIGRRLTEAAVTLATAARR